MYWPTNLCLSVLAVIKFKFGCDQTACSVHKPINCIYTLYTQYVYYFACTRQMRQAVYKLSRRRL